MYTTKYQAGLSVARFTLLASLCFSFLSGCTQIDRFINGSSKQEALAAKVKAQTVILKRVKSIMKRNSFNDPKLIGTSNSLGLWMAKELCSTPLHDLESEYHQRIIKADKSLKKKIFDDKFYDEAEAIDKHNQRMNIEYSLICQKNPSGDDLNKVLDSEVISHAYYHLKRKCSDRYTSKTITSMAIHNLFYFCK